MFQKRKLGAGGSGSRGRTFASDQATTPKDSEGYQYPVTNTLFSYSPADGRSGDNGRHSESLRSSAATPSFDNGSDLGHSYSLTSASEAAAARLFGMDFASRDLGPVGSRRMEHEERLNPQVESTLLFIEQQWGFMTSEQVRSDIHSSCWTSLIVVSSHVLAAV